MAVVAPLRGIRYNPEKIEKMDEVVTPPYDVIGKDEGDIFLRRNPYNMIQLDLRNTDSSLPEGDRNQRYQNARKLFEAWRQDHVLIRDARPCFYPYTIEYLHPSGKRLTRKGVVLLVRLSEFSEGIVLPHEETFSGVVDDRLQLMQTCGAQFSQVFSLYHDPQQAIMNLLEEGRQEEPLTSVRDHDGNVHTLWRVMDPEVILECQQLFADRKLYIADGHHRYTTALALRDRMREKQPGLGQDSPYNYIMMYLCGCEDPGLSVLPTHRLFRYPGAVGADGIISRVQDHFQVQEITGGTREGLVARLRESMDEFSQAGRMPAIGCYHAGEDRAFVLRVRSQAMQQPPLADKPEVLRHLDVVVLSELLFHAIFSVDHERCVRENLVSFHSDVDVALDRVVKESVADREHTPLLFLLNPTRVDQVTEVADQGLIMPHKSTYFYPKILTGLLINQLDEPVKVGGPDDTEA